jgi:hypothetical protein
MDQVDCIQDRAACIKCQKIIIFLYLHALPFKFWLKGPYGTFFIFAMHNFFMDIELRAGKKICFLNPKITNRLLKTKKGYSPKL